jgi:Mrp family chromosome partitioning ATPase
MEPIDLVGALRRSWRLLVALAVLGAVVAVLIPVTTVHRKPLALPYGAVVVVGSAPAGASNVVGGGVTSAQINFYASLISTQELAAQLDGLNVHNFVLYQYMESHLGSVNLAAGGVTTTTFKGRANTPDFVTLVAYGKTGVDAVNLANAYSTAVGRALSDASAAKGQTGGKGSASAAAASAASSSSSSSSSSGASTGYQVEQPAVDAVKIRRGGKASVTASRKVRLLGGLVFGLLIGAGIVLLRELLDKRLRNASRAAANFGYPVIVEIPRGGSSSRGSLAGPADYGDVIRNPGSSSAEAYRMLRMSVMFEGLAPSSPLPDAFNFGFGNLGGGATPETVPTAGSDGGIGARQIVLVVSAGLEPSRPHVAANLAAVYAEAGQKVVVISTGEIDASPGGNRSNGSVASGEITTEDVRAHLEPSRLENVSRLPLDPFVPNSGQLVNRAPLVLEAARKLSDVIIVEVPPLLGVHHAEALSHAVDVVIVVAECGWTTFSDARRAGDLLRRMEAPVLGVVLTNVQVDQRDIRHIVPVGPPSADIGPRSNGDASIAVGPGRPVPESPAATSQA